MKEFDTSQFARWGVPGWIAIFSYILFVLVDVFSTKPGTNPCIFPSIEAMITSTANISTFFITIVAAVAGIPLGFIIYQIYFFVRWNSPFSRDGFLPPFIVGRMDDLDRTLRKIKENISQITFNNDWRDEWVSHQLFNRDHGWRWRYIENLFYEAAQNIDTNYTDSIFDRHKQVIEVMHVLGSSIVGVYLGFIAYFFTKIYKEGIIFPTHIIVLIIMLFILLILLDIEDRKRIEIENKFGEDKQYIGLPISIYSKKLVYWKKMVTVSIAHPATLYLYILMMFVIFSSNSIFNSNPVMDLMLKITITSIFIIIWAIAKNKYKDISRGELLVLIIGLALAILIFDYRSFISTIVNIPFYNSMVVFVIFNFILLRNRQNSRDDVIAMEYYTIRRYLDKK